ncbi:MAG: hypothetical protein ACI30S_01620 [Muribaculaceae bacterium]
MKLLQSKTNVALAISIVSIFFISIIGFLIILYSFQDTNKDEKVCEDLSVTVNDGEYFDKIIIKDFCRHVYITFAADQTEVVFDNNIIKPQESVFVKDNSLIINAKDIPSYYSLHINLPSKQTIKQLDIEIDVWELEIDGMKTDTLNLTTNTYTNVSFVNTQINRLNTLDVNDITLDGNINTINANACGDFVLNLLNDSYCDSLNFHARGKSSIEVIGKQPIISVTKMDKNCPVAVYQ